LIAALLYSPESTALLGPPHGFAEARRESRIGHDQHRAKSWRMMSKREHIDAEKHIDGSHQEDIMMGKIAATKSSAKKRIEDILSLGEKTSMSRSRK